MRFYLPLKAANVTVTHRLLKKGLLIQTEPCLVFLIVLVQNSLFTCFPMKLSSVSPSTDGVNGLLV